MPVHHSVIIQGGPPPTPISGIVEGVNALPCTIEGHTDTVRLLMQYVDDGNGNMIPSFSLTDDEANDPNFGSVEIWYAG